MTPDLATTYPQSTRDEEALLAAVLDWSKAIGTAVEKALKPEHFYNRKNGVVFRSMLKAFAEGKHPDHVTVSSTLKRLGFSPPEEPDGPTEEYVWALIGKCPSPTNIGSYVDTVITLADRRAKMKGAQTILEGVGCQDDAEYRRLVQDGLEEVAVDYEIDAAPTSPEQISEFVTDYIEDDAPAEVFELPWATLNPLVLGGLRRGQTSVWPGWTNMGKSIALDQALEAFHQQGKRCGLFATEMSLLERITRRLTASTGIAAEKILLKQLTNDEKYKIAKAAYPNKIPFHFYDAQGWTYDRIAQRITLERFDVAAIDPINLIPGFADQEVITEAANRLQAVARRANCHLIMVCHLNRERLKTAVAPKPVLRDIRDSGMLANNADQVLFVHREQDDDGNPLRAGQIYWGKVRNGMRGYENVEFSPRHLRFIKAAPPDPAEDAEAMPGFVGATQ